MKETIRQYEDKIREYEYVINIAKEGRTSSKSKRGE
jgi:hypothetical protein